MPDFRIQAMKDRTLKAVVYKAAGRKPGEKPAGLSTWKSLAKPVTQPEALLRESVASRSRGVPNRSLCTIFHRAFLWGETHGLSTSFWTAET